MTMRRQGWIQSRFSTQRMCGLGGVLAALALAFPAAALDYVTAVPLIERDPTNSLNNAWSGGEWNTNSNFEGWSTANISGATVSGGIISGTSSSTNPIIQLTNIQNGPDLDLGYKDFLEFKIRLPVNYAGDIQIYYGVTNGGYADGYSVQSNLLGFAETRCFTVTNGVIAKDGASHVYRVNMALEVWYRGQLTDLRIDPATTSGTAFELDYVRIGDTGLVPTVKDYNNVDAPFSMQSKNFIFGWHQEAVDKVGMNANWAKLNLRNAEEAWAHHVYKLGYPRPRWQEDPANPYKINYYCVYGGNWSDCSATVQVGYYELRTDPPTWTMPHELTHCFQGRLSGGNFPGEYYEMHANYGRERWLDHFQALFPNQSGFVPGIMSEMHMNLPIGRDYYETWPIFLYLDANPDNLPDVGDGKVGSTIGVWQNMTSGEGSMYNTLKRTLPTSNVKDLLGYYARRGLNYNYPGFQQIKNKIGPIQEWEQLSEPIRRPDNSDWWQIPAERAPMQGGFAITELVPSNSVVTVQLHGLLVEGGGADWRGSLIVVSDAGAERYSTLMTNNASGSVTLAADEHKVYLAVAATPDDYQLYYYDEPAHPYRSDPAKRRFHYEFKVTGATPKVRDNGATTGLIQHANGGGWKASSAMVDVSAYIGPNARVLDTAQVRNFARVEDYAVVKESARLADMSVARGHAQVFGNSVMTNKAIVADFARLGGAAVMSGTARLLEHATVTGGTVTDQAVIKGSAGTWDGTFSGNAIGDGDYAFARDIRNAAIFGHLPWVGIPDNWLVPLPPGLFACYEFSAASELVARDTYAATDGIYRGAPGWEGTNGTHTGILLLNGTDQWVQLERAVADLPAMTVTAWVKWDGGAADQTLFQFGDGGSKYILFTPSNGSGVAELKASDGTTTYSIPAASALPVGVWIQVAVSLDGTYGKFTVNGGMAASGSLPMRPDQILPPNVAGNPAHNFIGRRTAGNFFDGSIDTFNVYGIAIPTFTLVTVDMLHSTVPENAPYESFRFTRTSLAGASTNGDLTITYTVTGTATSVDDYELLSGTVVISNGQSYADVQLRPVFDTITDDGETVTLTPAPSNDYTGIGSATITILDVHALSSSLLAWYRFNETTGTNAVDSSGNTNDAILVNGPAWSAGALSFDGVDDYVQTPVPNGGERTLSAWINPRTSSTGGTMASVFDTDVPGQYGTGWGVKDGKIVVILDDQFWFTDVTITHNEWQHFSLTFDATQARLYRNGVLAATLAYARGGITDATYKIGRSNANEYDCFDGEIRDAKIYDRTIYGPEAMEIYRATAPALAPRSLSALGGHGTVTLGWQSADAGETSYLVRRATVSGGPYTDIASGVIGTSFIDTTVANGTNYFYVVAAVSSAGTGPNSNEASVTPSAGSALPRPWQQGNIGTAAGSPTTAFSSGQFAVNGAGAYIKSGTGSGGSASDSFRFVYIPVVGDCTISARVVDLGSSDAAAKAGVMIRESLTAGSRHAATLLSTANLHFIRRTTASANAAQTTATLQSQPWVKIVRSGTSFSSHYSANGVNWTQIGTTTTVSMSTTATYYVGLAVCSGSTTTLANSIFSDVVITGGYPTGLSATAGNAQVALNWIGVIGATSYRVRRGMVSGGPYSLLASPTVTNYLDTAVTNGTTYYYVVSAYNGTAESTNSVQVFATPSAAQAGIPQDVAATDNGSQISLSWTTPANAVSNRVRRAGSPFGPFMVVGTTAGASLADTPVSTVSNYFYTVSGVNADNEEGPASAVVEVVRGLYFDPNGGAAGSVTNNGSYAWRSSSWAIAPGGLLTAAVWAGGKEARFAATDPGSPLTYSIDLAGYNTALHGDFSGIRVHAGTVNFGGNVDNFYLIGPVAVTAEPGAAIVLQQTRSGADVLAFNLNGQSATFQGDITVNSAGIGNNGSIIVGSGTLKLGNPIANYSPSATVLQAGSTLSNIGDAGKSFTLGALTMSGATLVALNAGHATYGNYILNGGLTVTGTAASVISADLRCQGNTTQALNVGETGVDVDLLISGRLGHFNGIAWSYANKTGVGTLKISGTNNLGGLTVSAGTVILEGPNAIAGMDVNSIVNNSAVTLSVPSGTISYPRQLLGTGLYTKSGAGTLELTSATSHTGNIRVQEGVLKITQAALGDTSALTVESGAQVELAFSGKDAVAAITLNGTPLPYGLYNSTTHPATFIGSGSLVLSPPTLIWNNSAQTGLWNLSDLNWTGVAWTNNYNALFSHTNVSQTVTLQGTLTANAVCVGNGGNNANYTFAGGALSAANITLQANGGNGSPVAATARFSGTTVSVPGGDIGIGRMGLVIGGSSTVTVARIGGAGIADVTSADWGQLTITNNAAVTATNGIVGNTTAWGLNLDGGTLTTKGINYGPHAFSGGTVNLKFNGTRVKASEPNANFLTVTGGVDFNPEILSGGAWLDSNGYDLGIGLALQGSGALTKLGTGTLTLKNVGSSYTGGTTVNEGTLTIDVQGSQTQSAVGVNKAVSVNSGATLRLAKTDALGLYGANPSSLLISGTMTIASAIHASVGNYGITLNGGTIASEGAGDVDGNYVFDGTITTLANANPSVISANTIKLRNNSGGGTANQSVTFDVADGAAITDLLVSSALINGNGANGLLKTNNGTLSLAGTNTYTGATIIRGGRLVLAQPCLSTASAVEIDSGSVLELTFSATNRVGSLKLGGVAMTPGVYNVSTHPAMFAGTGSLAILPSGTANYVGQVTDPQGNPVTNATVVLRLNATDIPSSVGATQCVTDVNGYYNIALQATNYVITASKTGYMIKSDTVLASDSVKNLQFASTNRNIPAMEWLLFAADSDDLPAVGGTGNWNLDYCTFDNRTALLPVAPAPAIVSEYGLKWMKGTGDLSSYKLNQYDWTTPVTNNGATVVSVVKIGDVAAKINDERDGQSVIVSFFNDSLTLAVWRDGRVFVKRNNVFTKSTLTFSKDQTVLFSLVVKPDGSFKVFARTLNVATGVFGVSNEVINETTTSPFTAFNPGGAWWLRQIQVGSLFGNAGIEGRAYWSGLIGDTFVYKGALSDVDRVTLENDIAAKMETAFQDMWKLTVTSSGNGSVQPSGTVWVRKGASQVFTLSPGLGYKIDTVTLDANPPVAISGSAWTNVTVSADGTNHFTFVALPPKTVSGIIKNSLNEPVAGAHVVLKVNVSDLPTAAGAYQTTTGADGSYQFPSVIVLPAAYTVVVSKEGYRIAFDTLAAEETVKNVTLSQRSRFVPSMEWLLFGATASGLGAENTAANWSLMYVDLPGYGKFDSPAVSITGATVTNLLSSKWGTMNGWDGVTWYQRACAYRVNRLGDLTAPIPVNGGSAVVLAQVGNLNLANKGGAESMLFTLFNFEFSLGLKAGGGAFVQCKGQTSATSAQTYSQGQTVLFSCVVQSNRSWEVWARVQNPDYSFGASQKILEAAQSSSFLSLTPGGPWWLNQVNIGNQDGNTQWEGTRYWAGGIGDSFVYKTALSEGERTLLERDVINDWTSRKGQGTMEFDCASGAPLPGYVEMNTGNMPAIVFSFTNGSLLDKSKNIFTVATAAAGVTLTGVPVLSGLTPDWKLENSGNAILLKYNRGLMMILR